MASILCHTNVSEVVSKYPPKPVSNLQLTPGKLSISLTWEDPEDYTEEGYTCTWAKTVVVRKTGGYPNDIHDGTIVVTTVERNKYKSGSYVDSNLTAGTTYYYRLFTCNSDGIYGTPTEGSAVPIQYKVMTVILNLNNSDPAKIGSYADDAIDMKSGKTDSAVDAWQNFFGYKPCLFKDGKVVGYLNPNDFAKFEDGTAADNRIDTNSGNAGDVMVEFPRRGVRISKSGNVVTVSMTDDPSDPNFKYYAHQRGSADKDYFYLGAYLGCIVNNKLRSLSAASPARDMSLENAYGLGQSNGTGYGCICYYQFLFIQVMYILQYKGNLDSQTVHGYGYCGSNSESIRYTGRSDTAGMMFGDTNVVKMFGLEDIYGNIAQWCNNFYIDTKYHINTTTDDTITDVEKYTDVGTFGDRKNSGVGYDNGYITMCIGSAETGFIGEYGGYGGSSSTYFCDTGSFYIYHVPIIGGTYNAFTAAGIFAFACNYSRTTVCSYVGSRLSYT